MLLRAADLDRIVTGEITLAFRRWRRPTVRAGGRLRTHRGVLDIVAVDRIAPARIRAEEARRAGYESRAELLSLLEERGAGEVYRIELRFGGADERLALRERIATGADAEELRAKLLRMDARSATGPWTAEVLALIAANPGVRAPDLAASRGEETKSFKARVRRLKELGLTISLGVGYRLSPRGAAWMESSAPSRRRKA